MKAAKNISERFIYIGVLIFLAQTFCSIPMHAQENTKQEVIYWHIKAVLPEAQLLDIKAIDKDGNVHDVKAIQESFDTSLLGIKALVNGQALPIKMIVKENDTYYPIKAIDDDGSILDIKAIGKDGEKLDVKGVSRMGSIIEVRAIDKEQRQYNVISISPQQGVNHVKGLKMFNEEVEAVIHGIKIVAHVKSLKQY